jgi:hypothetical protein
MFLMANILCPSFNATFEWLFTEAGHGKGAPDGVGGSLKRMADGYVSTGGSLHTSKDLLTIIPPGDGKILGLLVSLFGQ